MDPVVIIGSGLAGYTVAKEWRAKDKETPLVIITEDDGDFYSKPQLSIAYAKKKSVDDLVMTPGQEMAKQLNATLHTMTVIEGMDTVEKTVTFNGQTLVYRDCVLAMGGQSRALSIQGDAVDEVVSVNSLMDYRAIPEWLVSKKKIAIMGAGLVGMELANDWGQIGCDMHVIDPGHYPLMNLLPATLGETLQDCFNKQGVHFSLGAHVVDLSKSQAQVRVTLSNGDHFLVDGVLSAAGLVPNQTLAQQAGLAVNQGVVVDAYLRTSDSHVYALGDCAEIMGRWRPHIAPILVCARALASTLAGNETAVQFPAMVVNAKTPWCPVVVMPASTASGEWQVEGNGLSQRALFIDEKGFLQGFALLGSTISDRMTLTKQVNQRMSSH